jgi:ubiquitin-protein ligase
LTWELIRSLIRFHSQALNIPIETHQLSDDGYAPVNPENIQVIFRENPDEPVKSDGFQLHIGYPLTEDSIKPIANALENYLPALAQNYHKQKRDQLKQLVLLGVDRRKRSLKDSILQAEYTLDSLNRQVFELTRTRNIDRHVLAQLEKPHIPLGKKIVNEYRQLKKLVPGLYQSIQIDDDCIRAKTHQVNIYYDDTEYEIGVLSIELNLSSGQAKIHNLTNSANGYPHPHVNESGDICLGNVASGLRQLLGEFEIYGALELLHKFVHEYNENDAYQKIQYWADEDYSEDDDEYTRCREGGSYGRTCLDCGDGYCPYYELALGECIDSMTFENCVTCPDRCDPGRELLQECHDENPLNCMTCEYRTCLFYKDYEDCREVNEELCPTCNIEDCKYRGVPNETVAT